MTPEDDFATARKLYPYIKGMLHNDDEMVILAKKLYPHIESEFHRDVGRSIIRETSGMLRKALWAVGGAILAFFSFKWLK